MAVVTTPCPDCSHKPAQPFPDRLALDDPVSTARLGPIVGTAEQVEAPRAPCRWLSAWWPLERHERRLFGMNGQTEAGTPLRQDVHHPAGVGFPCAADDAIIRQTRSQALALHPGLPVMDTPFVHDSMQDYIRHHGRDHSALRCPLVRVTQCARLEYAGMEPLAEESHYAPITDPLLDQLSQMTPGQGVK